MRCGEMCGDENGMKWTEKKKIYSKRMWVVLEAMNILLILIFPFSVIFFFFVYGENRISTIDKTIWTGNGCVGKVCGWWGGHKVIYIEWADWKEVKMIYD